MEVAIGMMLRVGVMIAALVVIVGGVLYLRHPRVAAPDYAHFHSAPQEALIIQLGLLLLIATPVVRVIFALVGFLLERDKLYTLVSAVVLAILIFSLVHSR
jgi:uncharacterized membrane protein